MRENSASSDASSFRKNSVFVKFLKKSLTHNGFTYAPGLNTDTVPFYPFGSCQPGGLYFTELQYFMDFTRFGSLVADVTIPDNARVYADPEGKKWKADCIVLSNIRPVFQIFNGKTYDEIKKCLEYSGFALKFVDAEISASFPELCTLAVQQNKSTLEFVPDELKTVELCELAVRHNGYLLSEVPTHMRTKKMCEIAVQTCGGALAFIPESLRSPELCEIAVKLFGSALQYVPLEHRSIDLCTHACRRNGDALEFVPMELIHNYPELCKCAIEKCAGALYYVPAELRTFELCKLAYECSPYSFIYVPTHLQQAILRK